MGMDLLDLYGRASAWTLTKVPAATSKLEAETPCDGWNVRDLLNHMLEAQRFFVGSARGQEVSPPSPTPPELLSEAPVVDFEQARTETIATFGEPGVIEKTGLSLAAAFGDQLLHGWDLARATDQDATMPDGLAEAAYTLIHGRFTGEQRKGVFKPEVAVSPDASPQDRLLAYTGRDPQSSD
jgi:uncharacterized protein (TIGR03086 family)